MSNASLKLAMGQMLVEGGRIEENLRRAEQMIERASAARCDVIVLPECLDAGWLDRSASRNAEPIPGPRVERLAAAARRHGVFVAAGLTERDGDRLFNAAVLLGPDGRLLLGHRKINELRFGPPHDLYSAGNMLGVVRTEIGCIGLNICADNFRSSLVLGHTLGHMGANLLLSPCAWAVPADHDNIRTPYGGEWIAPYAQLATAHRMTIVGVSNVGRIDSGPWAGRHCIGNSLAVGPDGEVLARGPHGVAAERLIIVSI